MVKHLVVFALILAATWAVPTSRFINEERIIGGSNAPEGAYPYQVSLRTMLNSHFCGGSIISDSWILTAAHCVYGQSPSGMMIVVGTNYLNIDGNAYGVITAILHSSYNPHNNQHDIALVRVNGNLILGPKVKYIGLATSNPEAGSRLTLSGWGLTSFPSEQLPNSLQHINLTAISISKCQSALPGYPVFNTHVCTYQAPGKGACQGDSGGPLVYGNQQVGVVSWGIPCAKGSPDIFTSVASYRSWIYSTSGV